MRLQKIILVSLLLLVLGIVPVYADEKTEENQEIILPITGVKYSNGIPADQELCKDWFNKIQYQEPQIVVEKQACTIFTKSRANNSKDTAIPYSSLEDISGDHLFTLGMRADKLETAEQENWYTIHLDRDSTYFVDIRNMGVQNWNIEIRYYNTNDTFTFWTTRKDVFNGANEQYMYIKPSVSGTYYVRVYSVGDFTPSVYYFCVAPEYQTFTMSFNTAAYIPINGTTYYTYKTFDMSSGYVPKDSIVNSMKLSNNFIGTLQMCDKIVKSSNTGRSYTNRTGSGLELINITSSNKEKADQKWSISGKALSSISKTSHWSPVMTINFTCQMQPYLGN